MLGPSTVWEEVEGRGGQETPAGKEEANLVYYSRPNPMGHEV